MARLILLTLLITGCAGDARAPHVTETAYVLREAYVRDERGIGKPFNYTDCGIRKGFKKANPSPIEGYEQVLMCVPIGQR